MMAPQVQASFMSIPPSCFGCSCWVWAKQVQAVPVARNQGPGRKKNKETNPEKPTGKTSLL